MQLILLYLSILLVTFNLCVHGQNDFCAGSDKEQLWTRHFSSLTSYEKVHGTNMDKHSLVSDCEPTKVWILHRHGTRLPTKGVIEQLPRLEELQQQIKKNWETKSLKRTSSAICELDYWNIQMWRRNTSITVDQAEFLTSQGYNDLRGTALTYKKLFPGILAQPYDNKQFHFRHTDSQRTTESFKAFADGLFGGNNNAQAEPQPEKDYFLRPYDYCESWKGHDYNGPQTEDYKFKHSELWNKTLQEVSSRLGFDYTLEASDVELMYDACRYELAWKPDRTSPWCGAFLPEHIYTLEYSDDVHYYYKCGYGYDENSRINCRLVKDMLHHLNSSSQPNAVAYFAHSMGVQTLLTALGVAKDTTPLLATNFENMSKRQWTSSSIDPFASNFVAVKYECNPQNVNAEKEHVIFFLNQNIVDLEWCNVGLCSMSKVMERYRNFAEADCDSYYCRSGASALMGTSFVTLLMAAIAYLIY